jgi:hypothetical protein
MKKIILTAIAAASLCILSACGDDPEPTMAEKCSGGLTEACLVGNWSLTSIQSLDGSATYLDFGAIPSTLEFTKDGNFTFTCTSNTSVSEMAGRGCAGEKTYGKWEINGTSLKLKITRASCGEPPEGTYTVIPTITDTFMNFNALIFHSNDMTDDLTKQNSSEYFVRAAN